MTYVFDIDGTICVKMCENDGDFYHETTPFVDRIEKINQLYDEGHTIFYMTARGMGRHNNNSAFAIEEFYELTSAQLKSWGAKYHHLFLGKPAADFYIDDKGINDEQFFAN